MRVKETVRRQIARQIDTAASSAVNAIAVPSEGWIATMRKALGMTGAQLGRRMGLSGKRISQVEKAEMDGGVTLRSMQNFAEAMDANFVYAIFPKEGGVQGIINYQAYKKAEALVSRVSTHMALEKQALGESQEQAEIKRLADELIRKPPADFWKKE